MATIKDVNTLGERRVLLVDVDPSLSSGTPSRVGDLAITEGGLTFQKIGALDTEWLELATTKTSDQENLGALTWSAVIAPSGTINKLYKWSRSGKNVSFWCKIDASVSGTLVTAVEFDLPSDVPLPSIWDSQASGVIVVTGTGAIVNGSNAALPSLDGVKLFNSSGTYKIRIQTSAGLSADNCWCHLAWAAS